MWTDLAPKQEVTRRSFAGFHKSVINKQHKMENVGSNDNKNTEAQNAPQMGVNKLVRNVGTKISYTKVRIKNELWTKKDKKDRTMLMRATRTSFPPLLITRACWYSGATKR